LIVRRGVKEMRWMRFAMVTAVVFALLAASWIAVIDREATVKKPAADHAS
jgi:hypothetical protein